MTETRFGVPVEEFVADGKKANAKAQVNQAVDHLNRVIKEAQKIGVNLHILAGEGSVEVKYDA